VFPHCTGELLCAVEQVIKTKEKFQDIHAPLLKQFIPSRQMTRIRIAKYERVQKDGEPFSVYVQSIKDVTKVLRIDESEEQIVQRIVEGITPEQRARFIFQPRPSSFQHVKDLIIADRNMAYGDQTRKGPRVQVRRVA
jgi:hypothetical protein